MKTTVIPQGERGKNPRGKDMNTITTTVKHIDLSDDTWVIFLNGCSPKEWSFVVKELPVYAGINKANRALNAACDGAVKLDGVGFNKADTNIGSRVARNGIAYAGEVKALMWAKCLLKYRHQLADYGINYPDILFEGE